MRAFLKALILWALADGKPYKHDPSALDDESAQKAEK